ncbi:MAG: Fic family protein [Azoarcus sp.]|jgi:cell filamentation protein|nr:Fic family protein [Azoarcus sp.]
MQNKPSAANALTAEQRQQLEADCTFKRVVELELDPVRGNFDAAHLKEVNRRIFQDLPGAGFDDVTPGEFRKPVPDGLDWMKQRGLSTVDGPFYVAYSRMDEAATARLDKALEGAKPDELRSLKTAEFTAQLARIYAELDYVHPFSDGNSRTLRTFTKQLAKEAGYEVDWERFSRSEVERDLLYIARDRSVNELAKPHVQHENTMRKILHTQARLDGNRALPDLLRDAVRPSRAVAFELLSEREALKEYPELKEAYKTMHTAATYFALKMPGNLGAQEAGIQSVMNHVQNRLDAGETAKFFPGP